MSELQIPKISRFVILPPFMDEKEFEDFTLSYFNELEATKSYDLLGRKGQKQYGLDIFSIDKQTVIQCKCKISGTRKDSDIRDELLIELNEDFEEFAKFNKTVDNKFSKFLFISTFKDDSAISKECMNLSTNKVIVEYWSWNSLMRKIPMTVTNQYYGNFARKTREYFEQANNSINVEPNRKNANSSESTIAFSKTKRNWINKSKPILVQVHKYLSYHFKEVNFYPIHLLINEYPFRKDEKSYSYYNSFTLSIQNEDVLKFFESLQIKKNGDLSFGKKALIKGVSNHKEKTKEVLTYLSKNLIFNLEDRNNFKRIDIRYVNEKKCDCISCQLKRFEFDKAFKHLKDIPKDIDEKFRLAYTHYQIGNFLEAEKIFASLVEQSENDKLKVLQFIAQFNLSKLGVFIRNNYWGENRQKQLVEKLKGINLSSVYNELSTNENEKLLNWIKSVEFLNESQNKIQKITRKIRDHYYSQSRGGFSYNNHASELINEYAIVEAFLNQNHIVYDGFTEYLDLSDVFIEGLFISHGIRKPQNSRLESFDDWMLNKIIFYGKADRIIKFFNQHNLLEINYKKTSVEGDSFVELVVNFLDGNAKTRNAFKKYCEKDNTYFWDRYNTIFSNLMVLSGLVNLKRNEINKIADKLLEFLTSEQSIRSGNLRYVNTFINQKGKRIKKSTLVSFLLMSLQNRKVHGTGFIEAIINQINDHHGKIKLATKYIKQFEDISIGTCPICNQSHSSFIIVLLYNIIAEEDKKHQIKTRIVESLTKRFSEELYHMASVYSILEAKGVFFERLIELAKPAPNKILTQNVLSEKETRYPSLNMLINLCYKNDIDLSGDRFSHFKGTFPYYDWLLDMKNFDYNLFDPQWITEYPTKFYLKEIRKHDIVNSKICEYLKTSRDQEIERLSLEIFCNKNEVN